MEKLSSHGGNVYEAALQYGLKEKDILDFSANINPLGVPKCIRESIISNIGNLVNYPDPGCIELKKSISGYLKVQDESIIIGNGASEIIFLLFNVLQPRRVLIPAPTFSEYAKAAQNCGVEVEYFEMSEDQEYKPDIGKLCEKMTDSVDAVIICNPNNPTSILLDKEYLLKILEHAYSRNIHIILDEAFIELTVEGNKNSMVEYLKKFSNLFIIRAFTKVFAVPGLRLGYGLGNKRIIEKMWEKKLPWSVNTFACCLGKVLTDGEDYLKETSSWLEEEIGWLYNNLSGLQGLKVYKPNANFILVKILKNGLSAGALRESMAKKGILIRDASNFMFLDHRFFRVAVKDRKSNIRLLYVLKNEIDI